MSPLKSLLRASVLVVTTALVVPAVHADPIDSSNPAPRVQETVPTTPNGVAADAPVELSPYELAQLLHVRMIAYTIAPEATTQESAVRGAWRRGLKSRARRMASRMERVSDGRRWDASSTTVADWTPDSDATSQILRELSTLYVEIASAASAVDDTRIVRQPVLRFGFITVGTRREPTQEIVGNQVDGVRAMAVGMGTNGGGILMASSRTNRQIRVKIYDREVEDRMNRARQARVDAQVAGIRARIDAYTSSLNTDLELVRALAESVQLAEELRLADEAVQITDPEDRRQAELLLEQMRIGRVEARGLTFPRPSRYGHALRHDWLQKRSRLERLIASA